MNKKNTATAKLTAPSAKDLERLIQTYTNVRLYQILRKHCANTEYILEQEGISIDDLQPSVIGASPLYPYIAQLAAISN
jgi:hypothetical protein